MRDDTHHYPLTSKVRKMLLIASAVMLFAAGAAWQLGDRLLNMAAVSLFFHAGAVLLIPEAILFAILSFPQVSRMDVSADGVRIHTVSGDASARWRDVERLEGNAVAGEASRLFFTDVKWPRRTFLPLAGVNKSQNGIPLDPFVENWREGRFSQDLKQYAPQVFPVDDEEEW